MLIIFDGGNFIDDSHHKTRWRKSMEQLHPVIIWLWKKSAEVVSSAEFNWKSQAFEKLLDSIFVIYMI